MSTTYQHVEERPIAVGTCRRPQEPRSAPTRSAAAAHFAVLCAVTGLMSAVLQPPTSHALAAVVVASTTWTASLRLVYRSRWLAPRSVSPVMSTTLGTIAGLAVISTLGFWLPSVVPVEAISCSSPSGSSPPH